MPPNDANDVQIPPKKRRRVMDVPDGFQVNAPNLKTSAVHIPKFTSAFDEGKQPQKPVSKKPLSRTKLDPTSNFIVPKPVTVNSNKPKSQTNLRQLAVPSVSYFAKEKQKAPTTIPQLRALPNPRTLVNPNKDSSETTPHLLHRPPPPLPVLLESAKPASILKSLPAPTIFAPAETTVDSSLRTISTTGIALATDLFTDSGTAELAHIFLQDQHPDIAASNQEERPEWNIGMSPQKSLRHVKGKEFVKGGLASRASDVIARSHTSLALWQKETELQLASSLPCNMKADLRLRIINILDIPSGAKSSSRHGHNKPLLTSTGVATCRVISGPSRHPDLPTRIVEKQYHLVVLTFPTIAPPRLRGHGHSGVYARNPEDFKIGQEIHVWRPWDEVVLVHETPVGISPIDSMDLNAEIDVTRPIPAPFPTLPSTHPPPPSLPIDESEIRISDFAILCSRFVIMPRHS